MSVLLLLLLLPADLARVCRLASGGGWWDLVLELVVLASLELARQIRRRVSPPRPGGSVGVMVW